MRITWRTGAANCFGEIIPDCGKHSILVQDDLACPGVARSFGWDIYDVQSDQWGQCNHQSTDGTIRCNVCDVAASQFIASAVEWLRNHDGATVEDPGYFKQ